MEYPFGQFREGVLIVFPSSSLYPSSFLTGSTGQGADTSLILPPKYSIYFVLHMLENSLKASVLKLVRIFLIRSSIKLFKTN